MDERFFICKKCGNVIKVLVNGGGLITCCGEPMTELVPGTSDGAAEKHVPHVTLNGNQVTVQVGAVAHPMIPEHFIQFVWIETAGGVQAVQLNPGSNPEATFCISEKEVLKNVYAYCNLHGLWKAEMPSS